MPKTRAYRLHGGGQNIHITDTDVDVMFFPASIIPAFKENEISGGIGEPDVDAMTKAELKAHIRSLGIKGISAVKDNKPELKAFMERELAKRNTVVNSKPELVISELPASGNKTREELTKMSAGSLREYAKTKGVKNLLRKDKQQIIDILAPAPTRQQSSVDILPSPATNVMETPTQSTTETVGEVQANPALVVSGATEEEGHELFDERGWKPEIKAKWKNNPDDIPPEARPITLTREQVWNRPDEDEPFDMEKTYLIPKLSPNDPDVKRLRALMDEKANKFVKVSNARPGLGVGRTMPFGFIATRTDWNTHPTRTVNKDGVDVPLKYRKAQLSASSKEGDAKEMLDILVKIGRKINPLPFSTIQTNVDYQAKRHLDKGNKGLSMIFSLGDYEGGFLCVNGLKININLQPLLFNGKSNLHEVTPITSGHRYSFVYYLTATDNNGGLGVPIINYKNYVKTPAEEQRYKEALRGEDIQYSVDINEKHFPYEEGHEIDFTPEVDTTQHANLPTVELTNTIEMPTTAMPQMAQMKRPVYAPRPLPMKKPVAKPSGNVFIPRPLPSTGQRVEGTTPLFDPTVLRGEGDQDHYEAVARHLEGCGLLHLLDGGDHGKEGVVRINPPITVPASKVFTMKYEDDKIYVLPALPRSDPLLKALKEWMDDNELPINKSRANSGIGRSQTVGRVRQKFKSTFNESAFTKKHPDLKKLLHEIGKKYDPIGFTSIQVNQNYEAKPHIDKNNIGLSMIFAIGDYSGGDLYINDKKHNIAYHPLIFNGANNLHYVSKITQGDRYSFVFFKTGRKGAKKD